MTETSQAQEELIAEALEIVLAAERGYVNDPADPGGATKYGITVKTLRGHRGGPVTAADVRALQLEEARAIYRAQYIEKPGFLAITDPFLFSFIVDGAVNHGPGRAIKLLQRAVGAKEDGDLGPKTLAKLAELAPGQLARRALGERIRFYGRLISKDRTDDDRDGMTDSAEFAAGWADRMADFVERLP